MCSKIRAALGNVEFKKLVGYVEVDETFVGGKAKNKHKGPGIGGTGGHGKAVVVGAVRRKGNVIARVARMRKLLTASLKKPYRIRSVWFLPTNGQAIAISIGIFPHGVVHHGAHEYVHGNIHTQTIEGFWSLVKRGIIGTFHKVSKKYLPLYVNEFEFRYNNRMNPDIFGAATKAC